MAPSVVEDPSPGEDQNSNYITVTNNIRLCPETKNWAAYFQKFTGEKSGSWKCGGPGPKHAILSEHNLTGNNIRLYSGVTFWASNIVQ